MPVIRIPENLEAKIRNHLFTSTGEHVAFMLARTSGPAGAPIFLVERVLLIEDSAVEWTGDGHDVDTAALLDVLNVATRTGLALIEAHNHGGARPRFSEIDRRGLAEFTPYVLDSLPDRPYGATVWGEDHTVYGEFFLPGRKGAIRSIVSSGDRLTQLASPGDERPSVSDRYSRQEPWFTAAGQAMLGRLRVGIVGAGGLGSHVIQLLAYLGIQDFVLVEHDAIAETNMNRVVTATNADIDTPKCVLARRTILSVAPTARVRAIQDELQSAAALSSLQAVDVIFGCVDNDGARLVLNELALAYRIPYFDLAVGIDASRGSITAAGGRLSVILADGPCLNCMGEIDPGEAAYFLSDPESRASQRARGYVSGMEHPAPAVVSLNGQVASTAVTQLALFLSGAHRPPPKTELDLLGAGRSSHGQFMSPIGVKLLDGCVECTKAGLGDESQITRYLAV